MSRILYGLNPVLESLLHTPKQVRKVMLDKTKGGALKKIEQAASRAVVEIAWCTHEELDKLAQGGRHQGAVCFADDFTYTSIKEFLSEGTSGPRVLIMADHIQDPQNLGSILRAMGAFGAQLLVIGKDRGAPITPAVVKVSSGAAQVVQVAREGALANVIEQLKKAGFWIYGLEADGEALLHRTDLRGDVALVVGSEGKGLSRLVRERCDQVCRIPLTGAIRSLNAAMAVTCALYEVARQNPSEK